MVEPIAGVASITLAWAGWAETVPAITNRSPKLKSAAATIRVKRLNVCITTFCTFLSGVFSLHNEIYLSKTVHYVLVGSEKKTT